MASTVAGWLHPRISTNLLEGRREVVVSTSSRCSCGATTVLRDTLQIVCGTRRSTSASSLTCPPYPWRLEGGSVGGTSSSLVSGGRKLSRASRLSFVAPTINKSAQIWKCRALAGQQNGATDDAAKDKKESSTKQYEKIEYVYDPKRKMEEFAKANFPDDFSSMRRSLTLFSPSKINVFLRITGKRPDGFHELASLFHVIDLGDIIKFSISPSTTRDSLTSNVFGVPLDDKNLIIKALKLYRQKTGADKHFWIHLDKRVPTGAGLGGGSGNAATALWAANEMCGNLASESDLLEWGAEIGSDVPIFFSKGAAYVTGRGEVVQDIPSPFALDTPMVLIKPKEECPTGAIYKRFNLGKASAADPEKLLQKIIHEGISQDTCINDLESPAFEMLPSLRSLKQRIAASSRGRYSAVFMSGSGSTIVAVGDPDPPPFIYEEEMYADAFVTEARFLVRNSNEWYSPAGAGQTRADEARPVDDGGAQPASGSGMGSIMDLRLPFSYES